MNNIWVFFNSLYFTMKVKYFINQYFIKQFFFKPPRVLVFIFVFVFKLPYYIGYSYCYIWFLIFKHSFKFFGILFYFIIRLFLKYIIFYLFYFVFISSLVFILDKCVIGDEKGFLILLINLIGDKNLISSDNFNKFNLIYGGVGDNEGLQSEFINFINLRLAQDLSIDKITTLSEFFKVDNNFMGDIVSHSESTFYFNKYKFFKILIFLKYLIVWLIERFWVFGHFFLVLKYCIWFFLLFISKFLPIFFFNIINLIFFFVSDFSILEFNFFFKNNIIEFVYFVFDTIQGFVLYSIKVYNISNSGVLTSSKRLYLNFNDYGYLKDIHSIIDPQIFNEQTFYLYMDKDLVDSLSYQSMRMDSLIEGSPYIFKQYDYDVRVNGLFDRFDEGLCNDYWENLNLVREDTFSKTTFDSSFIVNSNRYGLDKSYSLFNVNMHDAPMLVTGDNFFPALREVHHKGFFGLYKYGSFEKRAIKFSEEQMRSFTTSEKRKFLDVLPQKNARHHYSFFGRAYSMPYLLHRRITGYSYPYTTDPESFGVNEPFVEGPFDGVYLRGKTAPTIAGEYFFQNRFGSVLSNPKPIWFNFGHKEYVDGIITSVFFKFIVNSFLLFLNLVYFIIRFFYCCIFSYYFFLFLILLVFTRGLFLWYYIDLYNILKLKYNSALKIGSLYNLTFLVSNVENNIHIPVENRYDKEILYFWKLNYNYLHLTRYDFFNFKNLIQLGKRIFDALLEFFYFFFKGVFYIFSYVLVNIFEFKFEVLILYGVICKNIIFTNYKLSYSLLNSFKNFSYSFFFWFFFIFVKNFLFLIFIVLKWGIVLISLYILWIFINYKLIILEDIYNIVITDFFPTYFSVVFIFIILLIIALMKNSLSDQIFGEIEDYVFELVEDDLFEHEEEDWEQWAEDSITDYYMDMLDFSIENIPKIKTDIGFDSDLVITDIGLNSKERNILGSFDIFLFSSKYRVVEKSGLGDNVFEAHFLWYYKNYVKNSAMLLITMFVPSTFYTRDFYRFFYSNYFRTFFVDNFFEIMPDEELEIHIDFTYETDSFYGYYVEPRLLRSIFATLDTYLPEIEYYNHNDVLSEFFFDSVYDISLYESYLSLYSKKSELSSIYRNLILDNSLDILKYGYFIKSYKKIGDFIQFIHVKDKEQLNYDYDILLDVDYVDIFKDCYIGFQLNWGLKSSILNYANIVLLNPYELYDNKYKREFYDNLLFYKKLLGFNLFPFLTNYDFTRLLFVLNCTENEWDSLDDGKEYFVLKFPIYEYPIFLFLSFQFFLYENFLDYFDELEDDFDYLFFDEYENVHYSCLEYFYDTNFFLTEFLHYINYMFETILLILTVPGYIHENCWRFGREFFIEFYFFIYLNDLCGSMFLIDLNTIYYVDLVFIILNIWFFILRIGYGFILYDFFFFFF